MLLCFCVCIVLSQDLEKAAKAGQDLEKQVQQLQKQCADTLAAATSKEVCTYELSGLRRGVSVAQLLPAAESATTGSLHVQQCYRLHGRLRGLTTTTYAIRVFLFACWRPAGFFAGRDQEAAGPD
jgi:hypothetical protein